MTVTLALFGLSACAPNSGLDAGTTSASSVDGGDCESLTDSSRPTPTPEADALGNAIVAFRDTPTDLGFGNLIQTGGNRVDVWWRGGVPETLQRQITSATTVDVRVHPAKYSNKQIYDGLHKIKPQGPDLAALEVGYAYGTMACDASGIEFGYVPGPESAAPDAIRAALEKLTGVDVVELRAVSEPGTDGPYDVPSSLWPTPSPT